MTRTSTMMQRIYEEIERSTAQGIYEGHKRIARKYLREEPVMMSPRAIHIVSRFVRARKRLAALEEAA